MAVLHEGKVEQIGDPRTVYRSPANRFVADFIGETNWISARVKSASSAGLLTETALGEMTAGPRGAVRAGEEIWLGFRPEAVRVGADAVNSFKTTIAHVSYLGETEQYLLEMAPGSVIKAFEQNPREIRRVGESLTVHVRPQDCLLLQKD